MSLRGYMVSGPEPTEGAVLVFAKTAKEARRLGSPVIDSYWGYEFIETRVRWLREAVDADWPGEGPRVIEPPVCVECELWHSTPLEDGTCADCAEFDAWERVDYGATP